MVPLAVIEIMGNVGFYYRSISGKVKRGRATRHSKERQMQNDKINRNFIEKYHAGTKYIPLLKEEILGDCGKDGKDDTHDTIRYLAENLGGYIK